jgi:hypothetical protein
MIMQCTLPPVHRFIACQSVKHHNPAYHNSETALAAQHSSTAALLTTMPEPQMQPGGACSPLASAVRQAPEATSNTGCAQASPSATERGGPTSW